MRTAKRSASPRRRRNAYSRRRARTDCRSSCTPISCRTWTARALAAKLGALSADHLEYTNDAGVAAMAKAGTVAVLLPGAFYALRETRLPPVAALRARAACRWRSPPTAIPGTSPTTSLPLMLNMACTLFRLTPEEALAGVTVHAARALGLSDRGALRRALRADLALLDDRRAGRARVSDRRQRQRRRRPRRPDRAVERIMNALWELHRGDGPARHRCSACRHVRADRDRLRASRSAARAWPDTDWHVEKLYAFARDAGATLLCATHSRYVVDLNRDPSGAALYAGADNTEVCPTRTFADEPMYDGWQRAAPDEVAQRIATYFDPYHQTLAAEIERVRARHGYAVLLDGHSISERSAALLRGPACPTSISGPPTARAARRRCRHGRGRAGRRAGLHARRQRPLQGRLDHAALRAAGRRRSRVAAGNGAALLHGRGAAVSVGRGARGARWSACCADSLPCSTNGGPPHDPLLHRAGSATTRGSSPTG